MKLGLRQRVAFWCAGLVVVSGVAVVLLVVVLTGSRLKANNDPQSLGIQPPDAVTTPQGGGSGPAGGLGQGAGPGPGQQVQPAGPTPLQNAQKAAADRTFGEVRMIGLGAVLGLTAVAIGVAWLVAGRIVRPIRAVTDTARSVAGDKQLDRRIAYDGPPDELHELADEFDHMLDKLEAVFDAQRAFVSNTSHELRTPLAIMQTEVEVALDDPDAEVDELRKSLSTIGDEIKRTNGLVQSMLALSRAEAVLDPKPVDLADVAGRVLETERRRHPDQIFHLDLGSAPTEGDPVLLGQLVGNLVRNAIAYNIPGGMVSVQTSCTDDRVLLQVDNDGPQVDPAIIPTLFARFVRRAEATEGHGLGLAICHAIVTTHDGTISAAPRPAGGLAVTAELPARRPPSGPRSPA